MNMKIQENATAFATYFVILDATKGKSPLYRTLVMLSVIKK